MEYSASMYAHTIRVSRVVYFLHLGTVYVVVNGSEQLRDAADS